MINRISVDPLKENSLMYLYSIRDEVDFDPEYQRQSDIWPLSKRQLLIDSLLNYLDIPKIYLHEVNKKERDGRYIRYAVVDGKQRLEAVFAFLDGKYSVGRDFKDLAGVFGEYSGLKFSEFGTRNLKLKARFEALPLPVYIIKTDDLELIEEMFSRLNEASPLNAAEKRNAFGGPLPIAIRKLSEHKFFQKCVPFTNARYRHYDLIAKMLLWAKEKKICDTKKRHLDKFVKDFRNASEADISEIVSDCNRTLNSMTAIFIKSDPLLRMAATIQLCYFIFLMRKAEGKLFRSILSQFEDERKKNRLLAQEDEDAKSVNYQWIEYDRLVQSPNDSAAIEFRNKVFMEYLHDKKTTKRTSAGKKT